jgi:hypothetical protein
MKKHSVQIANAFIIFIGLLGLRTPYLTDAFTAIGLDGFLDEALLQPFFIVFLVIAIYGHIIKIKDTLSFMPVLLELLFGILGFFYIFPYENPIVGYISLGGMLFLVLYPFVRKLLRKKKIVTIKV